MRYALKRRDAITTISEDTEGWHIKLAFHVSFNVTVKFFFDSSQETAAYDAITVLKSLDGISVEIEGED